MKFLALLLLTLVYKVTVAGNIVFVVYYAAGKSSITTSKMPLKKGDKLSATDVINLTEGSRIILVCSNYKALQLVKKGNYAVKALLQRCDKDPAAYSSSYFKYVWEQFSHPHGAPEKHPEEYMKNVGAVSRGCNDVAIGITIDSLYYIDGTLPIFWKAGFEPAYISVYSHLYDGARLVKLPLEKGKYIDMNTALATLEPGEYYWQIEGEESGGCERNYVKILNKLAYKEALANYVKQIPVTTAAETAFATGFLLEENHFKAAALAYYRKAAKLQPANTIFKQSLAKFYETNF